MKIDADASRFVVGDTHIPSISEWYGVLIFAAIAIAYILP